MTAYPRINARLEIQLSERVDRLCKRTGSTVTHVVRDALTLYCDAHEQQSSVLDVLSALGLVGSMHAPADYAENAKRAYGDVLAEKYAPSKGR